MFQWLKRKAQIASVRAMETDLDRFLLGLKGANSVELGIVLALGAYWQDKLLRNFGWDVTDPVLLEKENPTVAITIGRLIRETQRDTPHMAPGLMLWLHSFRAANTPELTLKGREMWIELQRGVDYVQSVIDELTLAGVQIDVADFEDMIPIGLEPL